MSVNNQLQNFNSSLVFHPEKAMGPHSSTFAWKIPRTEEPGRLQSMGSLELDMTEWLHFHFSLSCTGEGNGNPLHSSVLAWRIPGTGKPGGLPFVGSHIVGHDWSDLAAAARYPEHRRFVIETIYWVKWLLCALGVRTHSLFLALVEGLAPFFLVFHLVPITYLLFVMELCRIRFSF